jgi:hypothetical protein
MSPMPTEALTTRWRGADAGRLLVDGSAPVAWSRPSADLGHPGVAKKASSKYAAEATPRIARFAP